MLHIRTPRIQNLFVGGVLLRVIRVVPLVLFAAADVGATEHLQRHALTQVDVKELPRHCESRAKSPHTAHQTGFILRRSVRAGGGQGALVVVEPVLGAQLNVPLVHTPKPSKVAGKWVRHSAVGAIQHMEKLIDHAERVHATGRQVEMPLSQMPVDQMPRDVDLSGARPQDLGLLTGGGFTPAPPGTILSWVAGGIHPLIHLEHMRPLVKRVTELFGRTADAITSPLALLEMSGRAGLGFGYTSQRTDRSAGPEAWEPMLAKPRIAVTFVAPQGVLPGFDLEIVPPHGTFGHQDLSLLSEIALTAEQKMGNWLSAMPWEKTTATDLEGLRVVIRNSPVIEVGATLTPEAHRRLLKRFVRKP